MIACLFLHPTDSLLQFMSEDKAKEPSISRAGKIVCISIFVVAVIVAAWFRFYQIGLKPFHHDEGVNSYFLLNLAHTGQYKYDPTNYHGPSLYYFALVAVRIFGENDFALRLTPVVFGLITVAMVWLLRRHLGAVGTPVAAFCLGLSPCLVYFSRDFIHEMIFGCATLGIIVGAWLYAESRKFVWLAMGAVSFGLLLTTKETAVINVAVLLVAIVCAGLADAVRKLIRQRQFTPAALARELKQDIAIALPSLDHFLAAIIILVFIYVFLYSSFFSHWQGVTDFFKSITHWTEERSSKDHVKTFWYYFGILFKLELPLLAGSLLAGLVILWRGTRFWLFIGAATFGMTLAYSIIGYKTPWLMISFVVLMALVCGYAAEQVYRLLPMISLRVLWLAVVAIALIASGRMAWTVNFEKFDDNGNEVGYFAEFGKKREFKPYVDGLYGYVYAQTDREILDLVDQVKAEAARFPTKDGTGIYVASPDYWPLPWYLRDYERTAYTGDWPKPLGESLNISQPMVIANVSQQSYLVGAPGWRISSRAYKLRPGVELVLFVRDETPQQ